MKRVVVGLVALSILLLATPDLAHAKRGACKIEGTWVGFNTFVETFVMTINRTGAKSYTAVGQAPIAPAPFFEFVIGEFPGVQGDLYRTGLNRFDSSWIVVNWIDPTYDFDADALFGEAECGAGWDLMAIAVSGSMTMPTCDTWAATFDAEFIVYSFGTDPFQDGCNMGNPFGTAEALYQRLPKLP